MLLDVVGAGLVALEAADCMRKEELQKNSPHDPKSVPGERWIWLGPRAKLKVEIANHREVNFIWKLLVLPF